MLTPEQYIAAIKRGYPATVEAPLLHFRRGPEGYFVSSKVIGDPYGSRVYCCLANKRLYLYLTVTAFSNELCLSLSSLCPRRLPRPLVDLLVIPAARENICTNEATRISSLISAAITPTDGRAIAMAEIQADAEMAATARRIQEDIPFRSLRPAVSYAPVVQFPGADLPEPEVANELRRQWRDLYTALSHAHLTTTVDHGTQDQTVIQVLRSTANE